MTSAAVVCFLVMLVAPLRDIEPRHKIDRKIAARHGLRARSFSRIRLVIKEPDIFSSPEADGAPTVFAR